MKPTQTIALAIAAILILILVIFLIVYRQFQKSAVVYQTVGKVEYITKGKLPFVRYACVSYTRHGKPYQAMTGPLLRWKYYKPKSLHQWHIKTYHIPGREKLVLAKLKERRAR